MNAAERNKAILSKYIPPPAVPIITEWIYQHNFKLKIKKPRLTKHGDYTPPYKGKNHVITINKDLNPYAFLITLIHEVAHLLAWEKYKNRVMPHGKEWQQEYSILLSLFLRLDSDLSSDNKLFPAEIKRALQKHVTRPSASSCTDINLYRVLTQFDPQAHTLTLEKLPAGASFRILSASHKPLSDMFIKGEKRRTRYRCVQLLTKKEYWVHALCKVVLP
jgi:hypothetical protein